MAAHLPAVRIPSCVQIASSFFPRSPSSSSSRRGGRRVGHAAGAPPASADSGRQGHHQEALPRVVGPCGCGTRTVRVVAEDIALRRRATRQLRTPELVKRALAKDVLPLVSNPFDRGAVVVASKEICAHVSAACANSRVALGGVRVLVLIDTFQCPVPVVFRALPPPCKPLWSGAVKNKNVIARTDDPCMDLESKLPATKWPRQPVSVVGDRRVKQVEEACVDRRFKGWLPW